MWLKLNFKNITCNLSPPKSELNLTKSPFKNNNENGDYNLSALRVGVRSMSIEPKTRQD